MRKYPITDRFDKEYYAHHIGVNYNNGLQIGGNASSYSEKFDNEDEVNIETGIGDIRHGVIGNIKEAYEILKRHLEDARPSNIYEYSECVQKTILDYFGDYSNINERLSYFPDEEMVDLGASMGKVSDLAHKNAAMCIERAMVSQNLLKDLGFDVTFKVSGVIVNGKIEAHAYNLLSYNDKYYLFDATIPTIRDDEISPIICEIPKEFYEKIKNPSSDIGASIHVTHYNPLMGKEYDITYDSKRKDLYEVERQSVK